MLKKDSSSTSGWYRNHEQNRGQDQEGNVHGYRHISRSPRARFLAYDTVIKSIKVTRPVARGASALAPSAMYRSLVKSGSSSLIKTAVFEPINTGFAISLCLGGHITPSAVPDIAIA
ncbi:hypothetical protein EVAR_51718_1 [Eumeta japonica]|uniref:Uncharacterized protein n=1 Tax=Eumeta variegata TaxID=151549 RepID=A0A4C1XFW8_EUMVA|nr:hypothetical protein EVAR_51718_1 [Eumeta japonica]